MASHGTFRGSKSLRNSILWIPLILVLTVLGTDHAVFAQTKPERQSKAAKSTAIRGGVEHDRIQLERVRGERFRQAGRQAFQGHEVSHDRPLSAAGAR